MGPHTASSTGVFVATALFTLALAIVALAVDAADILIAGITYTGGT